VNAEVGYQFRSRTGVQLSILNLLNQTADDIQYAYASRLRGETSDGVDDVHFHPAEPRQVRASVRYRF
jgi:outer membrane receptor protein involved in Fe transport